MFTTGDKLLNVMKEEEISIMELSRILRTGGGLDNSRSRIYAKYQQGKTPEEMAEFLKNEYGTTGKGFDFGSNPISVWFNESGIQTVPNMTF